MTDDAIIESPPNDADPTNSARQPQAALATLVGATAGAMAIALCTLWLGAPVGIIAALAATLAALANRRVPAACAFVAAGALSAFALRPSTTLVLLAAVCFATGLALAIGRVPSAELLA
jgi:hypothetical protein